MISLDQIRLLEERVLGVVERLNELRNENRTLRESLSTYQTRIDELEERVKGYSDSQAEIEKGILNALQQLDELEDEVTETAQSSSPEPVIRETVSDEPETASEEPAPEPEPEAAQPAEESPVDSPDDITVETDEDVASGPELEIF